MQYAACQAYLHAAWPSFLNPVSRRGKCCDIPKQVIKARNKQSKKKDGTMVTAAIRGLAGGKKRKKRIRRKRLTGTRAIRILRLKISCRGCSHTLYAK
jgi:hypothetical protein